MAVRYFGWALDRRKTKERRSILGCPVSRFTFAVGGFYFLTGAVLFLLHVLGRYQTERYLVLLGAIGLGLVVFCTVRDFVIHKRFLNLSVDPTSH